MTAVALPLTSNRHLPRVVLLPLGCCVAGAAALAARWIADDVLRFAYGLVLCAAFFGGAVLLRRAANALWPLAWAFGVFAFVQLLNNTLPGFVATEVLHAPPTAADPLAATVSASVAIQLLDTVIAVVPVVLFTYLAGQSMSSIYLTRKLTLRWLLGAVAFFVVFGAFVALRGAERLLPANAPLNMALAPALLVMAASNGLQEEVLFRGLFLQKYEMLFGARIANLVQALVFTFAHLGITYSASTALFLIVAVLPLGIAAGYLMRASRSIVVPWIVHAALDIPIYLVFLAAVS
jgi:membrane protease YdiL (CAAX protease family)